VILHGEGTSAFKRGAARLQIEITKTTRPEVTVKKKVSETKKTPGLKMKGTTHYSKRERANSNLHKPMKKHRKTSKGDGQEDTHFNTGENRQRKDLGCQC